MARLSDSVTSEREYLAALDCPPIEQPAFNPPAPLSAQQVALVSSAGLMRRGDSNVHAGAADYRSFGNDINDSDLLINHVSINFDRTAFAEDVNTVFPRRQLQALADDGLIGGCADTHYAFMGATAPDKMQPHATELAGKLQADGVTAVCLLPV